MRFVSDEFLALCPDELHLHDVTIVQVAETQTTRSGDENVEYGIDKLRRQAK